jgi:hypothetical protein
LDDALVRSLQGSCQEGLKESDAKDRQVFE